MKQDSNRVSLSMFGEPEAVAAEVVRSSGRRMWLLTSRAMAPGAAVAFESGGSLLLGEVISCSLGRDGFDIALELDQAVANAAEVGRLARALLGEGFTASCRIQ